MPTDAALAVAGFAGIAVAIWILRRTIKLRRLVAALVAVAVLAGPAWALGRAERRALQELNQDRVQHGLDRLRATDRLSNYAERHVRKMAAAHTLFHSDLSFKKPAGWRCAAENIGYGLSVPSLERQFMNSAPHRENILSRCFDRIGLGVVRSGGLTWEVQVFLG